MPDAIITQILSDETSLTSGVDLFIGPRRAYDPQSFIPHQCVFVLATGGIRSRPIKGGPDERKINVQVWIRSDHLSSPNSFRDGQILAKRILNTVDQRRLLGLCDVRAVASFPNSLGPDDDSHWEWTINFEVTLDYDGSYGTFFVGVNAASEPYTEADIQALLEFGGIPTAAMTTTVSPSVQHILYAYPDEFNGKTPSKYTIGTLGLPGDMSEVQTGLAVVDAFGVSRLYTVARSDHLLDAGITGDPIPLTVVD